MIQIEPVHPEDWSAALELAHANVPTFQRADRVQNCLNLLENGLLDPRGIWIARDTGSIVAAQVCVPLGGAACLFWLPTGTDDVSAALVQAGLNWCRSLGCKLAQALAKPTEARWSAPLLRSGFRTIAPRLHQWGRELRDLPALGVSPLRFECYRTHLAAEFAATLERTYEGTLDCPELNGVRSMDEIVAGHRAQGKFHAGFWWLAYDIARPIGVIMLTEMSDGLTWELAYVGLVPEYRGRGLARTLVLHALHALRTQPATQMILAVDERNKPARKLYQTLGFIEIETAEAMLYFF